MLGFGILKGKKTYVSAAIGAIGAVAAYLVGDMALADAAQIVLTAIIGATIRHGVATEGGKTPQ